MTATGGDGGARASGTLGGVDAARAVSHAVVADVGVLLALAGAGAVVLGHPIDADAPDGDVLAASVGAADGAPDHALAVRAEAAAVAPAYRITAAVGDAVSVDAAVVARPRARRPGDPMGRAGALAGNGPRAAAAPAGLPLHRAARVAHVAGATELAGLHLLGAAPLAVAGPRLQQGAARARQAAARGVGTVELAATLAVAVSGVLAARR